jgi:phage recombination protein Bet
MTTKTREVATTDNQTNKGVTVYNVGGYEIKLSKEIVRYTLLRGQDNVTDDEIVSFIALCKFNKLNPFIRECFLVKYKNAPAQMIVSKDAFFKRADTCPNYDGFEAGIIVTDGDGDVIEKDGCFVAPSETLVGGWCKVHRTDRTHPTVAKVNLSEYDKNQSVWAEKKSTMIAKVAKVQALREAFPNQLSTLYTQDEFAGGNFESVDVQIEAEKAERANAETIGISAGEDISQFDAESADMPISENIPGF